MGHRGHQGGHQGGHHAHELDPTTHTIELDQLRSLTVALAAAAEARSGPSIAAEELGLTGASVKHGKAGDTLSGSALLVDLSYDGPPEYPYIYGHFTGSDGQVEMHTAALRALAKHLHLQQLWGV